MAPPLGRDRTGVSDDTTRKSQNHPEAVGAAPDTSAAAPGTAGRADASGRARRKGCARCVRAAPIVSGCARGAGAAPGLCTGAASDAVGPRPVHRGCARRVGPRPVCRGCARRVGLCPGYRGRARWGVFAPDAARLRPRCRGRTRSVCPVCVRRRRAASGVPGLRLSCRAAPDAPVAPDVRASTAVSGLCPSCRGGLVRVVRPRGVPRSGEGPSGRGRRRPGRAGRRRAGRPRHPPAARRRPCGRRP